MHSLTANEDILLAFVIAGDDGGVFPAVSELLTRQVFQAGWVTVDLWHGGEGDEDDVIILFDLIVGSRTKAHPSSPVPRRLNADDDRPRPHVIQAGLLYGEPDQRPLLVFYSRTELPGWTTSYGVRFEVENAEEHVREAGLGRTPARMRKQ